MVGGVNGKRCKLVQKIAPITPIKQGQCASMPRPSNGYMRCTRRKIRGRFPLGTKCKLKCRNGYTPSGYMRKKCVETGYWVGTDATCEDEKRLRVVTSKSTTTTTVLFNDELFYYKYLANPTSERICSL